MAQSFVISKLKTSLLGPFYGAIAVPSVTRCRCCCCGHRFERRRRAIVATPGEWQCKIRTGGVQRLAVANGPNIFQMLLVVDSHLGNIRLDESRFKFGE